MSDFDRCRTGLGKTEEVIEYYESWLTELETEIELREEEFAVDKVDAEIWAQKHPIRSIFVSGRKFDESDRYALYGKKYVAQSVKRALDEARYNERVGIPMTRVHMEFFTIDE